MKKRKECSIPIEKRLEINPLYIYQKSVNKWYIHLKRSCQQLGVAAA